MNRDAIDAFMKSRVSGYRSIEELKGDASTRKYYRLYRDGSPLILCLDDLLPRTPPGEYSFLIVQTLLKNNGVPVPGVLEIFPGEGILLLQDLGDLLLEDIIPRITPEERTASYERLLEIMVSLQRIPPADMPPFRLAFDEEKLLFEFDFFLQHALRIYFKIQEDNPALREIRNGFAAITGELVRPEHFVLNHRDFHSRNVMICGEQYYLIDFQDARMGLPQYDAVSLLRDSYVDDAYMDLEHLRKYYYDLAREAGILHMSPEEYEYLFEIMSFQRNIKAVGTFAYQKTSLGRDRYEPCIGKTLRSVFRYAPAQKILRKTAALIQELTGVRP